MSNSPLGTRCRKRRLIPCSRLRFRKRHAAGDSKLSRIISHRGSVVSFVQATFCNLKLGIRMRIPLAGDQKLSTEISRQPGKKVADQAVTTNNTGKTNKAIPFETPAVPLDTDFPSLSELQSDPEEKALLELENRVCSHGDTVHYAKEP